MRFYAVRRGRSVGIYNSWQEANVQVYQFSRAECKKFNSLDEAEDYMNQDNINPDDSDDDNSNNNNNNSSVLESKSSTPCSKKRKSGSLAEEFDCVVWTDGAVRGNQLQKKGPAGMGIVINALRTDKEYRLSYPVKKGATNNEVEYAAVSEALRQCKALHFTRVLLKSDSLLVVNQLNGKWAINVPKLQQCWDDIQALVQSSFKLVRFEHVPREDNEIADNLANKAIDDALRNATASAKR
jgi:ribonuclease HI